MEQNNKDTLIYKIAALVIFIILAAFIVLVIVSTALSKGEDEQIPTPPVTESEEETERILPQDTQETETTAQTEAPETLPETPSAQPQDTTPVSAPDSNVGEELAEFLAGYPDTVLKETEDAG